MVLSEPEGLQRSRPVSGGCLGILAAAGRGEGVGDLPQALQRHEAVPDSAIAEELLHSHADVFRDLTQPRWRNVATLVGWNGGAAAARIAELLMGAPLPDEFEAQ